MNSHSSRLRPSLGIALLVLGFGIVTSPICAQRVNPNEGKPSPTASSGLTLSSRTLAYRMMSWKEYSTRQYRQPYILEIYTHRGGLIYIGTNHTDDPKDEQLSAIEILWKEFQPKSRSTKARRSLRWLAADKTQSGWGSGDWLNIWLIKIRPIKRPLPQRLWSPGSRTRSPIFAIKAFILSKLKFSIFFGTEQTLRRISLSTSKRE
jgi:hypothetical protein